MQIDIPESVEKELYHLNRIVESDESLEKRDEAFKKVLEIAIEYKVLATLQQVENIFYHPQFGSVMNLTMPKTYEAFVQHQMSRADQQRNAGGIN